MRKKSDQWGSHKDQLFRELVEAGATLEAITEKLNATAEELKRRAYVLGLPKKWFRSSQLSDLFRSPSGRVGHIGG